VPSFGELLIPSARPVGPAVAWLGVRALAQLPGGRERLTRFADLRGEGGDARTRFLEVYGAEPELASGVQAWWMVQVFGQARELAGAAHLRDWPGRVRELLLVEAELGEETIVLGADDLWRLRRRGWVRGLAEARLREARMLLTEAPPMWFDAVLSAGQAWEALRRGREEEFRAAWGRTGEDVERGARLEAEVEARLEAWERRLQAEDR
jgi:hypothetical protein